MYVLSKYCITSSESFSLLSLISKSINTPFCTMSSFIVTLTAIFIVPESSHWSKGNTLHQNIWLHVISISFYKQNMVSISSVICFIWWNIKNCYWLYFMLFYSFVCSVVLVFQLFGLRLSHNVDRSRITDRLYLLISKTHKHHEKCV